MEYNSVKSVLLFLALILIWLRAFPEYKTAQTEMNGKDKSNILRSRWTSFGVRYAICQQFDFSVYVIAVSTAFLCFTDFFFRHCLYALQELKPCLRLSAAHYFIGIAYTGYYNLLFRLNLF